MWQMYFCPNCRAQIVYSQKFCSNCGAQLGWLVQPVKPIMPDPQSYNQSLIRREPKQNQKCHTHDERNAVTQAHNQQTGRVTTKMRNEIVKLLAEFLDKQIKYN